MKPNSAHQILARLENKFDISIITQNVDELHERAGSTSVLHLHGRLDYAKSEMTGERSQIDGAFLNLGDLCENGCQLRPDIVWFGEEVPNMEIAESIVQQADILIVIGTSLNVYPAANLAYCAPDETIKHLIDPSNVNVSTIQNIYLIQEKATTGLPKVVERLEKLF